MNQSRKKKLIFAVIKGMIAVLVVLWIVREIGKAMNVVQSLSPESTGGLSQYDTELRPGWIVLAIVCYLLGYFPAGVYWHIVLRKLGQRPAFYASIRAYYIGHLGKYLPGKAMVVALRAGLVRGDQVKTTVAVASVFLETLTMMAAGALISAILLFVFFREQTVLMLVALGLMVVSGLPVVPFFFRKIVQLAGVFKGADKNHENADPNDVTMNRALNDFNMKTLLRGWGLMAVGWTFLGLSLCATINGVGISTDNLIVHLPRFVAASALSTVAGFLSMLPGGLGVREMVLTELMNRYFENIAQVTALPGGMDPRTAGLVVAAVARLISLFSELAVAAVLYLIPPRTSQKASDRSV